MRRIKRLRDAEIVLEIRSPQFIRPPRDGQREWLVNQALNEFSINLVHLHEAAERFVPGAEGERPAHWRADALQDEDIMEDWQVPLMRRMAEIVTGRGGSILEIGFGRGVSAEFIQSHRPEVHTIIEMSDAIVPRFEAWRATHPEQDIRLVHSRWEDAVPGLGTFDGVFFHTYPMNETEYIEQVTRSVTYAAHFFETAARLLRPGGIFTYLTNEIDSFSRPHQRLLLAHFERMSLEIVPLKVPPDTHDAWWADSMVVVEARK